MIHDDDVTVHQLVYDCGYENVQTYHDELYGESYHDFDCVISYCEKLILYNHHVWILFYPDNDVNGVNFSNACDEMNFFSNDAFLKEYHHLQLDDQSDISFLLYSFGLDFDSQFQLQFQPVIYSHLFFQFFIISDVSFFLYSHVLPIVYSNLTFLYYFQILMESC